MSTNEKNSFVMIYKEAEPEERFKIMMNNYAIFPKEIRKAEKKLQFRIKAEQEWARHRSVEELGVRVQTSNLGDQTANEAINNVMIEEAFNTGRLDQSILKGISDTSEFEEAFLLIRVMKMDFELLEELVDGMPNRDSKIMKDRFLEGKIYKEISEEEGITIEAVKKRIEKLYQDLKEEILEYLEVSSGRRISS